MRLKTILHLASLFPILLSVLFILHIVVLHVSVFVLGQAHDGIPMTGAMAMAILSLAVGWGFYRAGHKLVVQVDTLENMAEQVKSGDLKAAESIPTGKGEVAAVAKVFSQLVVELRGYVDLIGAHKQLKQEYEDALARTEKIRQSAVLTSGALELLNRAERGVISWMIEEDVFLFNWLPYRTLREALEAMINPGEREPAESASETQKTLLALVGNSERAQQKREGDSRTHLPENLSICDAFDDAVCLCRWKWKSEEDHPEIDIKINKGGKGPFEIHADRLNLVQAIAAVLMNAAEAMPEGGTITSEFTTDEGGTVNLSITDMGRGMSENVRAHCTRPFFSTKEGRLGIGLTFANRFATRCGARLGVISEPGMGASVHMSFPGKHRKVKADASILKSAGPLSILLVEDDEAVRETITSLLSREKHTVTSVKDGAEAVLQLRESSFDVVVTDKAMPIMTGEELALVVKTRYPLTPVILLTASGEEMKRKHIHPEGVDIILSKPVLREDLRIALAHAIEQGEASLT